MIRKNKEIQTGKKYEKFENNKNKRMEKTFINY